MTGPEGEQPGGYWQISEVDEPTRFVVHDGFTDEAGRPRSRRPRDDGGAARRDSPAAPG